MRKDDSLGTVGNKGAGFSKKDLGDELAFNGQLPPGERIQNQLGASSTVKVTGLGVNRASSLLASGTKKLG